jgi:hypothetical protein
MMPLLLLSLSASLSLENDLLANDLVVALALRPVADIGPQATEAKGPSQEAAVTVSGATSKSTTKLIDCDVPRFASPTYMVCGRVKYEDVEGDGYLELLSSFADNGTYFTRGLADWGAMQKLHGTSGWRDFELPFHADPGMELKHLTLNVVLPGGGKVTVAQPLTVVRIDTSHQWWTESQGGLVGGGMGTLFGILGATIGLAASWGKSRRWAIILCCVGLAISGVSLILSLIALATHQPYHVYYPLLLIGIIGLGVLGFNLRQIIRRFQDDELRRMTAADVG